MVRMIVLAQGVLIAKEREISTNCLKVGFEVLDATHGIAKKCDVVGSERARGKSLRESVHAGDEFAARMSRLLRRLACDDVKGGGHCRIPAGSKCGARRAICSIGALR